MKNALHWIAFIWFNVLSLVIDLKPLVFNSNLFISLWRSSRNYMSIPIFYQCILLMNKFCLPLPPKIRASPMLLCNPQHVLIVAIRRAIDYFDINEWCLFDGESSTLRRIHIANPFNYIAAGYFHFEREIQRAHIMRNCLRWHHQFQFHLISRRQKINTNFIKIEETQSYCDFIWNATLGVA